MKKREEAKGFKTTPELSYIHLTEEVGEVARRLFNKKARLGKYYEANLKEEVSDLLMELMVSANSCNIDLDKEANKKFKALYERLVFSQD